MKSLKLLPTLCRLTWSDHGSNAPKILYSLHSNDMVKGCSGGLPISCFLGSRFGIIRGNILLTIQGHRGRSGSRLLWLFAPLPAYTSFGTLLIYTSGRHCPVVSSPLVESLAFDSVFIRGNILLTQQGNRRRVLLGVVVSLGGTTNHSKALI